MICADCGSDEIMPPSRDDYDHICVDCGHSWPAGYLREIEEILSS